MELHNSYLWYQNTETMIGKILSYTAVILMIIISLPLVIIYGMHATAMGVVNTVRNSI